MKKMILLLFYFLSLGFNLYAQQEQIQILTYYPAPYGVYRNLRTTQDTYLATDSGRVGIGTTNPGTGTILDIVRSAQGEVALRISNPSTSADTNTQTALNVNALNNDISIFACSENRQDPYWKDMGGMVARDSSGGLILGAVKPNPSGGVIRFLTGGWGNERMVINSNGNVGIGATSPTSKLDILTTGAGLNGIRVSNSSDGDAASIVLSGPAGDNSPSISAYSGSTYVQTYYNVTDDAMYTQIVNDSDARIIFRNANSGAALTMLSNGRVGIGTPAPTSRLSVDGDQDILATFNRTSPSTRTSQISFESEIVDTPDHGWIMGMTSGASFVIQHKESPGEPFHIAPLTGFVGIGAFNLTSDYQLVVDGKIQMKDSGSTEPKYVYDIAEIFSVNKDANAGDIVIIDSSENRLLRKSQKEYDSRVAGIISKSPNFAMGSKEELAKTNPDQKYEYVALAGQVLCNATAENGPIESGDLLTTSSTPGHAMKAKPIGDINGYPVYAQGCIIGKALEPLKEGRGKILVLVCLM